MSRVEDTGWKLKEGFWDLGRLDGQVQKSGTEVWHRSLGRIRTPGEDPTIQATAYSLQGQTTALLLLGPGLMLGMFQIRVGQFGVGYADHLIHAKICTFSPALKLDIEK